MSLPVILLLFFSYNLNKVELVDHNHSRRFNSNFKSKFLLYLICKMSKVNLVDHHLEKNYPSREINFSYINPFIEPTDEEKELALNSTPDGVKSLISSCSCVFVISAWKLILENGNELYGIKRTCGIFNNLVASNPNIGLVVCIGNTDENIDLLNAIKKSVKSQKNIIFWEGCSNSWSLFSKKSVYLRPTSTDGNSISIHEAIHYKSKVIASDVVARPDGCILFEYANDDDYIEKITHEIRDLK